jgi:hypothetical protein
MQGRLQITHDSSLLNDTAAKAAQKGDEYRPVEVFCDNGSYSISQIIGSVNSLLVLAIVFAMLAAGTASIALREVCLWRRSEGLAE